MENRYCDIFICVIFLWWFYVVSGTMCSPVINILDNIVTHYIFYFSTVRRGTNWSITCPLNTKYYEGFYFVGYFWYYIHLISNQWLVLAIYVHFSLVLLYTTKSRDWASTWVGSHLNILMVIYFLYNICHIGSRNMKKITPFFDICNLFYSCSLNCITGEVFVIKIVNI